MNSPCAVAVEVRRLVSSMGGKEILPRTQRQHTNKRTNARPTQRKMTKIRGGCGKDNWHEGRREGEEKRRSSEGRKRGRRTTAGERSRRSDTGRSTCKPAEPKNEELDILRSRQETERRQVNVDFGVDAVCVSGMWTGFSFTTSTDSDYGLV